MSIASRFVPIAAPLIVLAGSAGAASPAGFTYRYFKESRPLALDVSRVAVFRADGVAARGVGVSIDGLAAPADTQLPILTLALLNVAEARRNASAVRSIVSAAGTGADASVEFVSPVFLGDDGGPLVVTRDVLIGFEPSIAPAQARAIVSQHLDGVILDEAFGDSPGVYRVRATSRDGFEVLAAANAIADLQEVRFAEPDMIFTGRSELVPTDPQFINQWALRNTAQLGGIAGQDMNAVKAWDITTGSSSIITVIIDVGVDPTHPDLNQRLPGVDTTSDGGAGEPFNACDKHGTAVAGCISMSLNNGVGGTGLAPGTRTASARTFISSLNCDGSWSSSASWTVSTLAFAESIGARVTNNSNYYGFTSSTISDKYNSTKANGMVHFASAGNNGTGAISYPSSIASVNSIAALNVNGARASFSQFGTGLDFSAPGVNVYSTDIQGTGGYDSGSNYAFVSGTSFASPLSAAVAALVLSYKPSLTAAQVERAMQQGARDLGAAGYDTGFGWGFVDAYRSLERVRCPADISFDGQVDDADFVFFANSYNILLCTDPTMIRVCAADINGDGLVDDSDFVLFAGAYDALLCP
ncbi:MAG: S8 family serine peptidase [Phycisphaerales bacterium]|nr:S8 family serine peptidase [Phycisphaerales bacterium]